MFSFSVVLYLFLAGAGSGTVFVVFCADSLFRRVRPQLFSRFRPHLASGLFVGIALVVAGVVFLLFDLGRFDRVLAFITSPQLNVMSIGVWSIVAFLLLCALQLALRLRCASRVAAPLHIAIRWTCALLALAVMAYTGVLLQSLGTVPFFASPLLPLLFVFSSCSCGVGVLLLIGFFSQPDNSILKPFVLFTRLHLLLIILEAGIIITYTLVIAQGSPTAVASLAQLLSGSVAGVFWGGVVLLGLALPFVLGCILRRHATWVGMAVYACAVLGGGLALRYCFLTVGAHPALVPGFM